MLIVIRSILVVAMGLYLSIIFLPEVLNVNETVAKYLYILFVGLWFIKSNNRWWINLISLILGTIISLFIFIALLEFTESI
ncbi:hypothetical protein M4D68_27990 [Priestia aryabhattai]|uniref:hypothetical protein n=1 Tax=Priestia aryabhattai TaxID=412384 RepID=UPI00203D4EE0|nr:hypothetical protein [Priestia aryabhattai]MCM3644957.1 hypothetical protein [Priestia aryabhattai]